MTISETTASIESKTDFEDTPAGKYKYWAEELNTSLAARKPWWKKADKIVSRYLGEKKNGDDSASFDLNMFHSNVNPTMM
mgnify:CR=1 FL=1